MIQNIAFISDIHYGSTDEPERSNITEFMKMATETDIGAVIVPGDLTSHGYDGEIIGECMWRLFGKHNFWCIGGGEVDELHMLKQKFIKPLEDAKKPIFLCHGNHDTYNGAGREPVLDYIDERYGGIPYRRDINTIVGTLSIYVCGLYPDETARRFLEKDLVHNINDIIIVFHYSLDSNWWSDAEKEEFRNVIRSNIHIRAIAVGHSHTSSISTWNGYMVINASGTEFALLNLHNMEAKLLKRGA
jgi:predicted phosphodiesterase